MQPSHCRSRASFFQHLPQHFPKSPVACLTCYHIGFRGSGLPYAGYIIVLGHEPTIQVSGLLGLSIVRSIVTSSLLQCSTTCGENLSCDMGSYITKISEASLFAFRHKDKTALCHCVPQGISTAGKPLPTGAGITRLLGASTGGSSEVAPKDSNIP